MAGNAAVHKPTFTIILPTHARSDVIGCAIRSVLLQRQQSFELIVVGDGAEPGTAEAVRAFDDTRVQWLDLPKAPGLGYANRNIALQRAEGKYIAFMADDDLLFPDHLDLLERQLNSGALLACTRAGWVSSDGIAAPFSNNLSLTDEFLGFLSVANSLPAACFAYRRDALEDGKHWPEDSFDAGDWQLWRRILSSRSDVPLSVESAYTVLHFAAKRRRSRFSGMPDLDILLRIADNAAWWPKVLKPALVDSQPEQSYYLEILQKSGPDALRQALQLVTDRLAWEAVQSHMPQRAPLLVPTMAKRPAASAPPADFDEALYLDMNPDVKSAGMNAKDHWLQYGQFEGRGYR
jgi:glycosyltransferase involved in cell wall biosynthesis